MGFDAKAVQSAIVAGLPERARWAIGGMTLDYQFCRGIRELTRADLEGEAEREISGLLIFGDCDYAEGGGAAAWIVLRAADGAVCGLDVERKDALFLFNSSIERFIQTFVLLDGFLSRGQPLPAEIEARTRDIDPEVYARSEWRLLIEHLMGTC